MKTLNLVMIGSHGCELDRVEFKVRDPEHCEREVLATLTREKWILSVGDRIEVQNPGTPQR